MDGRAGNEARAPIDAVGNKDGAGEIEGAVDTETMQLQVQRMAVL